MDLSVGEAKSLISALLLVVQSFREPQATQEKSTHEVCVDLAVVVLAMLSKNRTLAEFIISKLISLIRAIEKKPSHMEETLPVFFCFFHCLRMSSTLI